MANPQPFVEAECLQCDDVRTPVVTIEADLANHDPDRRWRVPDSSELTGGGVAAYAVDAGGHSEVTMPTAGLAGAAN